MLTRAISPSVAQVLLVLDPFHHIPDVGPVQTELCPVFPPETQNESQDQEFEVESDWQEDPEDSEVHPG